MIRTPRAFWVLLLFAGFVLQPASAITIPTVPIGSPGNPADMRYIDTDHPNGVGSVAQGFRIGHTELTNAQYVAFLNARSKRLRTKEAVPKQSERIRRECFEVVGNREGEAPAEPAAETN